MNYLLAILYMVTMAAVSVKVAKRTEKLNPFNIKKQFNYIFFSVAILIALIVGEFVLIANGFARLMEL